MKAIKGYFCFILSLCIILGAAGTLALGASASGEAAHTDHCLCGGSTEAGDHTAHANVIFTAWTQTDSLPSESGCYYLTGDVTLSALQTYADTVNITLCLNGYSVIQTAADVDVLELKENASLTLCDCRDRGTVTKQAAEGQAISGDGVTLSNSASLVMYGGDITESGGRGVYLSDSSSFTLYGGSITDHLGDGGVHLDNYSRFTMHGGIISGNSSSRGGGVEIFYGTFTMTGGTISGNNATDYGGGVFCRPNTEFILSGSPVIKGNTVGDVVSNLHLQMLFGTQAKVTVGELAEGADIGISLYQTGGIFSIGGADCAKYFSSDDPEYFIRGYVNDLILTKDEYSATVGAVTLEDGEYTTDGVTKAAGVPTGTGYAYMKYGELTLNGFVFSAPKGTNAIICEKFIKIKVIGENSITATSAHDKNVFLLNGGFEIYGGGVLNITGDYSVSIKALGDTCIIGNVTVNAKTTGYPTAISMTNLTLDGANVTISADYDGISTEKTVVKNSYLKINSGKASIFASASISLENSVCELSGSRALSVNPQGVIDVVKGKYIFKGREDDGAIYFTDSTLNLPKGSIGWRTDPDDEIVFGPYTYAKEQYLEIDTEYMNNIISGLNKEISDLTDAFEAALSDIEEKANELASKDAELTLKDAELAAKDNELAAAIEGAKGEAAADAASLEGANAELKGQLEQTKAELEGSISAGDSARASAKAAYILLAVVGAAALAGNAGWIIPLIKKKSK